MSYASVEFIFAILFVGLMTFIVPPKFRSWWLLGASLCWMGSWNVTWVPLYFAVANLNYFGMRLAEKTVLRRDLAFGSLLTVDVGLYLLFRSGGIGAWVFVPPYGASFILFMIMGAVIERWRREPADYSWCEFLLFSQFFLFLMGGPVEKVKVFLRELRTGLAFQTMNLLDGIILMGIGLVKVTLIWGPWARFLDLWEKQIDHGLWFVAFGLLNTWKVYLELSGLHDLGRGAARILGMRPTLNFRSVVFSQSPADFWLRWNISVGQWLRDNVSMPLMLNYGRKIPRDLLLLLTFFLMGIWHGVGWNFVLFGLFNGAMVILYSWGKNRKWPAIWGRGLAILLMAGNGLIPHLFELSVKSVTTTGGFQKALTPLALGATVLLLVYEFAQEIKKDPEFLFQSSRYLRGALALSFVILFFIALDRGAFDTVVNIPIYFKI